jgi:hypothetical protein
MYRIVNGKKIEMTPRQIADHLSLQEESRKEHAEIQAKEKQAQLDKIKKMQSAGLSDIAIIEVLPYAKEHLNDPKYLKEKEQECLQKQELEAKEKELQKAKKTQELQEKIHILKKKGFDKETIEIILPETKPLFKVNAAPKKRVGKIK